MILQAMVNDDPIAGAMPGAPLPRDINAASATTTLAGDIINSSTTKANVNVFLKNATLTERSPRPQLCLRPRSVAWTSPNIQLQR